MEIKRNFPLKNFNTFGINAEAKIFVPVSSDEEVREAFSEYKNEKHLILGGGSNLLFTKDFNGMVVKNEFRGKWLENEDEEHYYVKCGAGENWHEFVQYCIKNNYAGIENLSLIPGNVGASPMQNIGAYGVELKDVFHELEAIELSTGKKATFSKSDCRFGYRDSIFKNEARDRFIITSVNLKLNKTPEYNTSYGAIEQELEKLGVEELSIAAISQAVCNIRNSKLPNPKEMGNAGSFFKNPVVSLQEYERIKAINPEVVAYKVDDGHFKIAAGWMIEQCGWKGKRMNGFGVHDRQALVLVNYNGATGRQIYDLSSEILQSVKEKFGVELEREVNIV